MRELFITQTDAFLTWAGIMFLIYAFFWCRQVGREVIDCALEDRDVLGGASVLLYRLEQSRSKLVIEGRCWAMIAAATVSLWISAAWTGLAGI